MTPVVTHSQAKLATRLAFIAAGFGVACWTPLVPSAKARCQLDYGTMGLIPFHPDSGFDPLQCRSLLISAPRFGNKPIVPWRRIGDRLAPE